METAFMVLSKLDWSIIIIYLIISITIGLWFTKRGNKGLLEYFVERQEDEETQQLAACQIYQLIRNHSRSMVLSAVRELNGMNCAKIKALTIVPHSSFFCRFPDGSGVYSYRNASAGESVAAWLAG